MTRKSLGLSGLSDVGGVKNSELITFEASDYISKVRILLLNLLAMSRLSLFSAIAVFIVAASCGRRVDNVLGASAGTEGWTYENCFNGRLIVESGGLFGIADSKDSSIILQPEYSALEFISDDMAVGMKDGCWTLVGKDGCRIAESIDREFLEESADDLLESFSRLSMEGWDEILEMYDSLCNICLEKDADMGSMLSLLASIEEKAESVKTGMSPEQASRFQRIRERFDRLKK